MSKILRKSISVYILLVQYTVVHNLYDDRRKKKLQFHRQNWTRENLISYKYFMRINGQKQTIRRKKSFSFFFSLWMLKARNKIRKWTKWIMHEKFSHARKINTLLLLYSEHTINYSKESADRFINLTFF